MIIWKHTLSSLNLYVHLSNSRAEVELNLNAGDDDIAGEDDAYAAGDADAPLKCLQSYVSPLLSLPTRFNWQLRVFLTQIKMRMRMRKRVQIILKVIGDYD